MIQWRIQGRALEGLVPRLFLDQTEAPMAENIFFETTPLLSQGVDDRPPPPPPPPPLSEGLDPQLRHLTFFCPGGGISLIFTFRLHT